MDAQQLRPFIRKQLALMRISHAEIKHLETIRPVIDMVLEGVARDFYRHMRAFPEGKLLLSDDAMVAHLITKQSEHWGRLFSGVYDDAFARTALAIGKAHFENKVAPYLYIAGYAFFQSELTRELCNRCGGRRDLGELLSTITRVIALDMDLAISVYMKEYWSHPGEAAA